MLHKKSRSRISIWSSSPGNINILARAGPVTLPQRAFLWRRLAAACTQSWAAPLATSRGCPSWRPSDSSSSRWPAHTAHISLKNKNKKNNYTQFLPCCIGRREFARKISNISEIKDTIWHQWILKTFTSTSLFFLVERSCYNKLVEKLPIMWWSLNLLFLCAAHFLHWLIYFWLFKKSSVWQKDFWLQISNFLHSDFSLFSDCLTTRWIIIYI